MESKRVIFVAQKGSELWVFVSIDEQMVDVDGDEDLAVTFWFMETKF